MAHASMEGMKETIKEGGKKFWAKSNGVARGDREEDPITKRIESVTTNIPSSAFLGLAFGAMGAAWFLNGMRYRQEAQLLGQIAPAILIMGLYNKLVKLEGSERK